MIESNVNNPTTIGFAGAKSTLLILVGKMVLFNNRCCASMASDLSADANAVLIGHQVLPGFHVG
jgi:hypothetical protein